ncbi:Glycosyl transferase [Burkholderiales bacterium 8X]|nr:Glycosyl transferase [Burkholderiales bacterium 8X]
MKKALLFLLFAALALLLTTLVALVLVLKIALAPSADEWPARFKVGPATLEIGVPTALRLATSSWFAPWFAGRRFDTPQGPVQVGWNEASNTLQLDCAPCAVQVPSLGTEPLRLDRLRLTARRDGGTLNGMLEALPAATAPSATASDGGENLLRARWDGRLTQKALQLDIHVAEAPIARWYTALAPSIPELQRARIDGSLEARVQLGLPSGRYSVQPQISQFEVQGLGTEAMLNARSSCGPPARLATDSWLARAVVAAEDQRFFSHPGFDVVEMLASLEGNQKAGQVERGGSTITQQLARLLVTGSERSAERKLRELLYATEMEQTLGKARILQLYLDNAPWGLGICGAEAAARRYFKRPARNLEPLQAVWLATMLTNPQVALDRWRSTGQVDVARAKAVVEGLRGVGRGQRDALIKNLESARFAAPS